ncbi:MAG: aminotransferase class V-fold PLP-dependent enzyme [Bacteroidota bacterium]
MINIQQTRDDTPACEHYTHLNNAGASLVPRSVVNAQLDYIEFESRTGGYEAAAYRAAAIQAFYSRAAQLFNTESHHIAFMTSATEAFNKALSSIPFEEDDVILTTDDDYVSNQIAFLTLRKRMGIKIVRAAKYSDGGVNVNSVAELIQKHNPRLVAITHIPTNSGTIQDVAAIGKLCRQRGTWYIVDGCQSAGQLDIDIQAIGCDFYSATFRKFLRGPRGTGLLCISRRVVAENLTPLFPDLGGANWISPYDYEMVDNAKRFEYWERNYANLMGASAALTYAIDIGMPEIESRIKKLTQYTREKLAALPGFRLMDKGKNLGAIISLHSDRMTSHELKAYLINKNIHTSVTERSSALIDLDEKGVDSVLRISPHYYNTEAEIDHVVDMLSVTFD